MTMPLDGVRVLDLSRVLAGPFCTMMLGDMGADVLKVERPGAGDETRGWPEDLQSVLVRLAQEVEVGRSVALDPEHHFLASVDHAPVFDGLPLTREHGQAPRELGAPVLGDRGSAAHQRCGEQEAEGDAPRAQNRTPTPAPVVR